MQIGLQLSDPAAEVVVGDGWCRHWGHQLRQCYVHYLVSCVQASFNLVEVGTRQLEHRLVTVAFRDQAQRAVHFFLEVRVQIERMRLQNGHQLEALLAVQWAVYQLKTTRR